MNLNLCYSMRMLRVLEHVCPVGVVGNLETRKRSTTKSCQIDADRSLPNDENNFGRKRLINFIDRISLNGSLFYRLNRHVKIMPRSPQNYRFARNDILVMEKRECEIRNDITRTYENK